MHDTLWRIFKNIFILQDTTDYWPKDTTHKMRFGPLEVSMTSVDTEHPNLMVRDFEITNIKVTHFTTLPPTVPSILLVTGGIEGPYAQTEHVDFSGLAPATLDDLFVDVFLHVAPQLLRSATHSDEVNGL